MSITDKQEENRLTDLMKLYDSRCQFHRTQLAANRHMLKAVTKQLDKINQEKEENNQ
jgi:hypothetical protein